MVLILAPFVDRYVKYSEIILGSVGRDLNECLAQKVPKSLKSLL
jgi:hypothetical protein